MPEFESTPADTAVESTNTGASESFTGTESTESVIDTAPVQPEGDALDALPNEAAAPAYANFDPEALPETARPAYTALRGDFDAAAQFKTEVEPLVSWVNEIGGREAIEQDLQFLGNAFAEDPDQRASFHDAFYQASPSAYERFVGDILQSDFGREQVLQSLGLNPALIETYKQVSEDGTLNGEPIGGDPVAEPDFVAELPAELRNMFRALPREVQEDYALRSPVVAKYDLENAYRAQSEVQRQQQERQAQTQHAAQERQQRITQMQQQTYQQTRNIVMDSLKQAFEGDDLLPGVIASAVETEYFDSPEGQAQWMRVADLIAKGETRALKSELPLVISQVKALAANKSKHIAQIYSDARKWRASQQRENPRNEIGHGDPPGTTPSNGRPSGAGEYRPENLYRYWEQGARRS